MRAQIKGGVYGRRPCRLCGWAGICGVRLLFLRSKDSYLSSISTK